MIYSQNFKPLFFHLLLFTALAFTHYNINCILDLTAIDKFDIHSIIFQMNQKIDIELEIQLL